MNKWLVRNMTYSWDSKVFGSTFRHLRAVNVLVPLFLFAGLVNLFTEGFGWIDALVFVPFLLGFFVPLVNPSWEDLDWEQKVQVDSTNLNKRQLEEQRVDKVRWLEKYKSKERFVETWRFFSPIVWILVALLVYWFFGGTEEGFTEGRFF